MEPEGLLPRSQEPATRDSYMRFLIGLHLYDEELLAPRPTPKLEDHPLSALHDCLFIIFAATLPIWRPFLHPQPEDAPCRGDRDPLITVTGTHLSLWQGPTYHCDKDPLITAVVTTAFLEGLFVNCLIPDVEKFGL
jgi:hypothetical protein